MRFQPVVYLVSLGIVYGDIGTSPLYTLKAIFNSVVGGGQEVTSDLVLGALSCIIWTLTLQTTIKYVVITLRADNKGEGAYFRSIHWCVKMPNGWLSLPLLEVVPCWRMGLLPPALP